MLVKIEKTLQERFGSKFLQIILINIVVRNYR